MKIFLNEVNESWIVDRFRSEWYQYNAEISETKISQADVIWILSPWTWKKIPKNQLKNKPVLCSIHHLEHELKSTKGYKDFLERDKYVSYYHVLSEKSKKELQKLTNKDIFVAQFWINQNIFFHIENKKLLREKYGLNHDDYLIGSFQRDTEGKDLVSPKLIKGPDIFIEILKNNYLEKENLKIVLTGKRRNYVISELEKLNIKYKYFEMINFESLNELYNILDLYLITSRKEGGPQQVQEAAITKTPILSTDVGIVDLLLNKKSIYSSGTYKNAEVDTSYPFHQIQRLKIPQGFDDFISIFKKVLNES